MTTALTIALDLAERYARSAAVGARQYGYTDDLRDAESDLATIAKLRAEAPSRIRVDASDPETQAIFATSRAAAVEVAAWPAWKRGESPAPSEADVSRLAAHLRSIAERSICGVGDEPSADDWADMARAAIALGARMSPAASDKEPTP